MFSVKAGLFAVLVFIGFLSGCLSHPLKRIQSLPNGLLSNDFCIILQDKLEGLTVLFGNGLVFFGSRELIENELLLLLMIVTIAAIAGDDTSTRTIH